MKDRNGNELEQGDLVVITGKSYFHHYPKGSVCRIQQFRLEGCEASIVGNEEDEYPTSQHLKSYDIELTQDAHEDITMLVQHRVQLLTNLQYA